MKFPKNRDTVYVVMRHPTSKVSTLPGVPIGVFENPSDADDYAGACSQELEEKIGYGVYFCRVEITSFYV